MVLVVANAVAAFKMPAAPAKLNGKHVKTLEATRSKGIKHLRAAKEVLAKSRGELEVVTTRRRSGEVMTTPKPKPAAAIAVTFTRAEQEAACTAFWGGFDVSALCPVHSAEKVSDHVCS